ncbi:MAG: hypothetical protein ACYTG5_10665 [Planctomycetota bacterium]
MRNLINPLLVLSLTASVLSAQSSFGVSCPGSNGKDPLVSYPANAWMAAPSTGEFVSIVDGVPGAPAVLMIGRHPSSTVNFDLTGIGMPGCFQYVTPFKFLAVNGGVLDGNGAGTAILPVVPLGQEFSFQWIFLDAGAPRVLGVSASDGMVASMPSVQSAFRISSATLADPHVFTNQVSCTDITDSVFNAAVNDSFGSDGNGDLLLDASLMFSFRPLDPNAGEGIMDFVLPDCTAPIGSTVCSLPTAPEARVRYTNSQSICIGTEPGTTNWPVTTSTSGPCFISDPVDLTLNLNGIMVPLQDAQIGGKYVGNPPTQITEGLIRGFLSESVAGSTTLPAELPLIGGQSLASVLAGGIGNCSPTDARDVGPDGQTMGWWFYMNYTAETVDVSSEPPPDISYANDIYPIWDNRNCTGCHGNAGGLTLSGSVAASYAEVIDVVDLQNPANSEILTKPLDPSQGGVSHNGGTYFATTSDPDYQKILAWIIKGAKNN